MYIFNKSGKSYHTYITFLPRRLITIHSQILKPPNMVSEHQKQSNRKMNFRLQSHSLLPLLHPKFQVPRKAVFCHHQGNKKPPNSLKQMRQKPTEPTSPSRLPALLSSALPDSPWEKVASPPPHQPQCSDMPLFMHIKANSAPFCAADTRSQMRCLQEYSHIKKCFGFSSYMWSLMI